MGKANVHATFAYVALGVPQSGGADFYRPAAAKD